MTNKSVILKNKNMVIYKTNEIIGGHYSVVCLNSKRAKTGLTLDAATDIFNKLTLINK